MHTDLGQENTQVAASNCQLSRRAALLVSVRLTIHSLILSQAVCRFEEKRDFRKCNLLSFSDVNKWSHINYAPRTMKYSARTSYPFHCACSLANPCPLLPLLIVIDRGLAKSIGTLRLSLRINTVAQSCLLHTSVLVLIIVVLINLDFPLCDCVRVGLIILCGSISFFGGSLRRTLRSLWATFWRWRRQGTIWS